MNRFNEWHSRMTGGLDEVKTRVNAIVNDFLPVDTIFLFQVRIKPSVNIFDNGFPAIDDVKLFRVQGG
jgi:hypothetical protein